VSHRAGLESDSGSIRTIVCGGVQVYIYRAVGIEKQIPVDIGIIFGFLRLDGK
jgi:hypothetical protein